LRRIGKSEVDFENGKKEKILEKKVRVECVDFFFVLVALVELCVCGRQPGGCPVFFLGGPVIRSAGVL